MEYREDYAWKWWCGQPQKQVFIVHVVPFSSTVSSPSSYSFTCTSSPLSSIISLFFHHFYTSTLSIFPASPTLHSLLSYLKLCLLLFFLHIFLHFSLQYIFYILPVLSSNIRIPSSLCYISPSPRPLTLYFPFLLFLCHHRLYIIIVIPLWPLSNHLLI